MAYFLTDAVLSSQNRFHRMGQTEQEKMNASLFRFYGTITDSFPVEELLLERFYDHKTQRI